jgi:hypothetical protein
MERLWYRGANILDQLGHNVMWLWGEAGELQIFRGSSAKGGNLECCYVLARARGAKADINAVIRAKYNGKKRNRQDYGKPIFDEDGDISVVETQLLWQPPKYFHGTTVIIDKEGVELPVIIHDIKTRGKSYVYILGSDDGPEVTEKKLVTIVSKVITDGQE